tara:strand:- start:79 stop:273 length:195 start_codon:yes stop_codon:yes gene_type:complete
MNNYEECINALDFALTHKAGEKWSKCPYKYKYELVQWLVVYKGWTNTNANKLSKRQCYAIWYKS